MEDIYIVLPDEKARVLYAMRAMRMKQIRVAHLFTQQRMILSIPIPNPILREVASSAAAVVSVGTSRPPR